MKYSPPFEIPGLLTCRQCVQNNVMQSILTAYTSDDEELVPIKSALCTAPMILVAQANKTAFKLKENGTVENLFVGEEGPINPFMKASGTKTGAGNVQQIFIEDHFFDSSYHEHLEKSKIVKSKFSGIVFIQSHSV